MNDLIKTRQEINSLAEICQATKSYAESSRAKSSLKVYASDWRIFCAWCNLNNLTSLPSTPEIVAAFISNQAMTNFAPSTIKRRLASIYLRHKSAGFPPPTENYIVKATLKGIRRMSNHVVKKKSAATVDRIEEMIKLCPDNITGL